MPKRSRTGKPDVNQMASNLIDAISGDLPNEQPDRVSYHSSETIDLPAAPQYANDEDGSFAYVAMNADALYEKFPDRWILVHKAQVVRSASEPDELMRLARTLGIKEPFITMTGPPETPGKAVYGGQVL